MSTETSQVKPIIKPTRFHHLGIKTQQLDKMIEFYRQVLGVEEVARLPFAVFLAYDEQNANHRLVLFNSDNYFGATENDRIGLHHVAYEYDEIDELLANYVTLKEAGISPVWTTNHGPTTSFYYPDPDGNLVELQIDNFGSTEGSIAFMRTETFANNPVGADVDPEKLIAARKAGMSREELHRRGYAGEFVPEGGPVGPAAAGVGV
jgi:catechol 2,3-dioxygenase